MFYRRHTCSEACLQEAAMQMKYIERGSSCVSLCWVCSSITSPSYSDYVTMQRSFWPFQFLFFFCRNNYEFRKKKKLTKERENNNMICIFSATIAIIQPSIILFLSKSDPLEPTPNWVKGWDTTLDRSPLCHRERQTVTLAHNYSSFIVSLELLINLRRMPLDCGREP